MAKKETFLSFYFQMNFLASFANALSSPLSNWSGTNTENVIGGKTLSSYFLTSKKKREWKKFRHYYSRSLERPLYRGSMDKEFQLQQKILTPKIAYKTKRQCTRRSARGAAAHFNGRFPTGLRKSLSRWDEVDHCQKTYVLRYLNIAWKSRFSW